MTRQNLIAVLNLLRVKFDANTASNRQLKNLLNSRVTTVNTAKGKIFIAQNAEQTEEPAEIMICDEIGKDPWSGEGITVKDIRSALDAVTPKTRGLNFLTNSPGGSVSEGTAIRNLLNEWPGQITNTIIGIAASTASWCIPADEVRAYKSSQMFVHRSWGVVMGNADDMRAAIQFLETTDKQIAQIYSDETGQSQADMLAMMSEETLLTGEEALEEGFVDVIIDGAAQNRFSEEQISNMRQKLAALNTLRSAQQGAPTPTNQPQENPMKEKLALLNKRGITPPANATEAQVDELIKESNLGRTFNVSILKEWNVAHDENATDAQLTQLVKNGKPAPGPLNAPTLEGLQEQVNRLTQLENAAKRREVELAIDQLIIADKMTANERDEAIELAMNKEMGEKYLTSLKNRQAKPPGANPVGPILDALYGGSEDVRDIQKFVLENGIDFRRNFIGKNADKLSSYDDHQKAIVMKDIGNRAVEVARVLRNPKNKERIIAAWNANVIDVGLQRQVILQEYVEEYEIPLLPLRAFSTVFSNVPLEGTDEIDVAFYPLQGAASTSWNPAVGYAAPGGTAVQTRKVFIGGSGVASGAAATAGYFKDRLFQQMAYSSYEQSRQPYVNWQKLNGQNANKLGVDLFTAFVSRVIIRANYGVPAKIVAAPLFDGDAIADLAETATGLNWPVAMRQLTLDHTYRTPLLKDPTFKQYLSYGATDPIRKAVIQEAYGFGDVNIVANLSNYSPAGENLRGWINHISAALFATAPIMPSEAVRALLSRYDLAVGPQTGATIEYRRFGDVVLDKTNETVECNAGGGPGVQTALRLLASA